MVNYARHFATGVVFPRCKLMIFGGLLLLGIIPTTAQNAELQQKLATVKQAVAENKQKLLQYQWTETTQLTLKGDPKPTTQNLCRYAGV